jgi:hypothetical protein
MEQSITEIAASDWKVSTFLEFCQLTFEGDFAAR